MKKLLFILAIFLIVTSISFGVEAKSENKEFKMEETGDKIRIELEKEKNNMKKYSDKDQDIVRDIKFSQVESKFKPNGYFKTTLGTRGIYIGEYHWSNRDAGFQLLERPTPPSNMKNFIPLPKPSLKDKNGFSSKRLPVDFVIKNKFFLNFTERDSLLFESEYENLLSKENNISLDNSRNARIRMEHSHDFGKITDRVNLRSILSYEYRAENVPTTHIFEFDFSDYFIGTIIKKFTLEVNHDYIFLPMYTSIHKEGIASKIKIDLPWDINMDIKFDDLVAIQTRKEVANVIGNVSLDFSKEFLIYSKNKNNLKAGINTKFSGDWSYNLSSNPGEEHFYNFYKFKFGLGKALEYNYKINEDAMFFTKLGMDLKVNYIPIKDKNTKKSAISIDTKLNPIIESGFNLSF